MNSHSTINLALPADLCRAAEAKLLGERFATLPELLVFVLQELLQDDAQQMDAREEAVIEQRLRDLGYV